MSLRIRLERLERFGNEILREVSQTKPSDTVRILQLREAFNDECIATAKEIANDPAVRDEHELFSALQEGLEAVRTRLASHQLRWNAERIAEDRAGYFEAVQPIHDLMRDFFTNARVFLRD